MYLHCLNLCFFPIHDALSTLRHSMGFYACSTNLPHTVHHCRATHDQVLAEGWGLVWLWTQGCHGRASHSDFHFVVYILPNRKNLFPVCTCFVVFTIAGYRSMLSIHLVVYMLETLIYIISLAIIGNIVDTNCRNILLHVYHSKCGTVWHRHNHNRSIDSEVSRSLHLVQRASVSSNM